MPITFDESSLTIEKLVAIARDNEKVELAHIKLHMYSLTPRFHRANLYCPFLPQRSHVFG